jgi:hypothetical protein
MNIFAVDDCPTTAAVMLCDKHIPKMIVESTQMLVSALRRHGALDGDLPLTKSKRQPHKGGYHNHPCTRWTGDTRSNFVWLYDHALAMCVEFSKRYGKEHYAHFNQLVPMAHMISWVPDGPLTPFAQAMPDEYRRPDDPVWAYRLYYALDKSRFAVWARGTPAPDWFHELVEA